MTPTARPEERTEWAIARDKTYSEMSREALDILREDPVAIDAVLEFTGGAGLELLRQRLLAEGDIPLRLLTLAILEKWDGQVDSAAKRFRRCLDVGAGPVQHWAAYELALIEEQAGNIEEAIRLNRLAVKALSPHSRGNAAYNLGVLLSGRDESEAVSLYQLAIESEAPDATPAAQFNLAAIRLKNGESDKAVELLRRAAGSGHAELAPQAGFELGWILFNMQDVVGAIEAFVAVIKGPNPQYRAMAAVDLGTVYMAVGQSAAAKRSIDVARQAFGEARGCWEMALKSGNPKQVGMAERNLQKLDQVVDDVVKEMSKDPAFAIMATLAQAAKMGNSAFVEHSKALRQRSDKVISRSSDRQRRHPAEMRIGTGRSRTNSIVSRNVLIFFVIIFATTALAILSKKASIMGVVVALLVTLVGWTIFRLRS